MVRRVDEVEARRGAEREIIPMSWSIPQWPQWSWRDECRKGMGSRRQGSRRRRKHKRKEKE